MSDSNWKVGNKMAVSSRATARGGLLAWQVASAILLLVMGGIHVYLVVVAGWGGRIGTLFVFNGIGGAVLAVATLVTRGRLLGLASVLSLLFLGGTLLALVLSLTPSGVMGMHETIDGELVPTTLVAESIGVVVLAVTSVLALRTRR
jgi:hypothetical protein